MMLGWRGGTTVRHWICDREVDGSTSSRVALAYRSLCKLFNIYALGRVSSNSTIWYRCKNLEDNGRFWKRSTGRMLISMMYCSQG